MNIQKITPPVNLSDGRCDQGKRGGRMAACLSRGPSTFAMCLVEASVRVQSSVLM